MLSGVARVVGQKTRAYRFLLLEQFSVIQKKYYYYVQNDNPLRFSSVDRVCAFNGQMALAPSIVQLA